MDTVNAMDDPHLKPGEIGPRVAERRHAAGRDLEALAAASGLTADALAALESGARAPLVSELAAIAGALGIDADELLVREPDPPPLFRNSGGEESAEGAQREMEGIMTDYLSFRSVAGA